MKPARNDGEKGFGAADRRWQGRRDRAPTQPLVEIV
jgi:hypothetical protein